MKMADWAKFLDDFLTLNSYELLKDKGKVSALEAKIKAEAEYEAFRTRQDAEYESDFDRFVQEAKQLSGATKDGGTPEVRERSDEPEEGDNDG